MAESRRPAKRFRCAIYTRKSSEEGLEQAFNSLDAQREACAAFILSQKHEGWTVLPTLYDDGGFSGGTMDRPELQRLLSDIAEGKVDVVVVYKIDRLTRSLFDFAKIVEAFDAKGVSFVSITQQFTTSTSMLTLNVLLSFAQFERELASERIRDKIAASKKRGMWMGGLPPLGYDITDRKLVVNEDEARTVLDIFWRYIELRSVRALKAELDEAGIRSKRRTLTDGTPLWWPETRPRSPLSDAAEPHLSRRDHSQRQRLSRRASGDYRTSPVGPSSGHPCREPGRSGSRVACKAAKPSRGIGLR
jgi:site-specific DNA recombinase